MSAHSERGLPHCGMGGMTTAVTVLSSASGQPVNKLVTRRDDAITKAMARHDQCYLAQTVAAPDAAALADILREIGANADSSLSLGVFKDAPDAPFLVLPQKV